MNARVCVLAAVAALALAGCAHPAAAPPPADAPAPPRVLQDTALVEASPERAPWKPGLHDLHVVVEGQDAAGLLAVPQGKPTMLVVVAHGWGGDAASHRSDLEGIAQAGALGLAMDYRGPRSAFKVSAGVEDTVAATLLLQDAYPGLDRTLLYGWSMGGEVALLAALEAPPGTYDYVFAGAGVMDLEAFWHENLLARAAVERETGGPPMQDAAPYVQRSPMARAAELSGRGIARVFLVHGAADAVVTIDHAERMSEALRSAGVPVSYYVATRDRAAVCGPVGCVETSAPADHRVGRMQVLWPFVLHRLQGASDPSDPFLRGTYDADAGKYEPSDTA